MRLCLSFFWLRRPFGSVRATHRLSKKSEEETTGFVSFGTFFAPTGLSKGVILVDKQRPQNGNPKFICIFHTMRRARHDASPQRSSSEASTRQRGTKRKKSQETRREDADQANAPKCLHRRRGRAHSPHKQVIQPTHKTRALTKNRREKAKLFPARLIQAKTEALLARRPGEVGGSPKARA